MLKNMYSGYELKVPFYIHLITMKDKQQQKLVKRPIWWRETHDGSPWLRMDPTDLLVILINSHMFILTKK